MGISQGDAGNLALVIKTVGLMFRVCPVNLIKYHKPNKLNMGLFAHEEHNDYS